MYQFQIQVLGLRSLNGKIAGPKINHFCGLILSDLDSWNIYLRWNRVVWGVTDGDIVNRVTVLIWKDNMSVTIRGDVILESYGLLWRFRENQRSGVSIIQRIWLRVVGYLSTGTGLRQSHFILYSGLFSTLFEFLFVSFCFCYCVIMSPSRLLGKGVNDASQVAGGAKLKIKIPRFDNTALIAGYSKTVIGRCMNPRMQDMKTLLFMFPRIWQLEGRVVGADLGLGRFQFDFDKEEDIVTVLKMEPFHFDYWMVSMVRWQPSVDPLYPSSLTFWIRILGVPLQYWAEPTFRGIGEALGSVVAVEIDGGRVQVTLDGFKPLCFETTLEFDGGEEITVTLRYERLFGFCKRCNSLCHDTFYCPRGSGGGHGDGPELPPDDDEGRKPISYKAATVQDRRSYGSAEGKHGGGSKGKGTMGTLVDERKRFPKSQGNGGFRGKSERVIGEGSSRPRRYTSYAQAHNDRFMRSVPHDNLPRYAEEREVRSEEAVQAGGSEISQNTVKKALFSKDDQQQVLEDGGVVQGHNMENLGAGVTQEMETEFREEPVGMEMAGMNVSPTSTLFDKEETSASFSLLLAEVEASLPFGGEQARVVDSLDQFLEEQNEQIDSPCGDLLEEASLLEVPISESEVIGELDEVILQADSEQGKDKGNEQFLGKKKALKSGVLVLQGVNSRKRNVQILTSPRKRTTSKTEIRIGNGLNPKDQDRAKGLLGGAKPPKPTV